jgi:hypothetical protein
MRIDRGPGLAELQLSVENGTIVEFRNVNGERVRGRVLEGRLDPNVGRVNLVLEEDGTGLIWFARYRWGFRGCASGDIITWRLKRHELVDLAWNDQWPKCAGE